LPRRDEDHMRNRYGLVVMNLVSHSQALVADEFGFVHAVGSEDESVGGQEERDLLFCFCAMGKREG